MARALIAACLSLKGPDVTETDSRDAASAFAAGETLAYGGRWEEARAAFFEAARLAPEASITWLSLALVLWQLHEYDNAANAIEWALRAVPIPGSPEMREGWVHYRAGRWAEGQEAFEAAVARGVPDSPPHLLLSLCLLRQGRTDEAHRELFAGFELEERASRPE